MKNKIPIQVPKDKIRIFCKKYHVKKLSFFGSMLRNDFSADSDLDVLIEFQPNQKIGYLDMARMEEELSAIMNKKVDLRTPAELSRYFRQEVLENAEVQYAEG